MKKLYFFAALILAAPFISFGQSNYKPGYVINFKGDTLKGFIDYREWDINPDVINFKKAMGDKNGIKYSTSDIKFFTINGSESFVEYNGPISTDPVDVNVGVSARDTSFRVAAIFLKLLERGDRLALYSYKDDLKIRYFISEGPNYIPKELVFKIYNNPNYDPNVPVNEDKLTAEKAYKRQLVLLAQKYNELTNSLTVYIQRSEYMEDDLLKIVSTINHISKAEFAKTHVAGSIFNLFAGVALNINTSSPNAQSFLYAAGGRSSTSYLPAVLFGGNIFANSATRKLQFRIELSAAESRYKSLYTSKVSPYTPTEVSYNGLALSISPQVLYNFYNADNFKIFGGAGLIISELNFSNAYLGSENHDNSEAQLTAAEPFFFYKSGDAFLIKAGVQFTKNIAIFINYQSSMVVSQNTYFGLYSTSTQLGLIYLFR